MVSKAKEDAENNNFVLESATRDLLNSLQDPIVNITDVGIIEFANKACLSLFDYTEAEILGQNIKFLMPEPYHSKHDGYLANYKKTSIKSIIDTGRELVAQRKDGSTLPIFLSVSEYKIGEHSHYTGTLRDLSREKEAEKALLQEREKYAGIISAALDPIILITPRGNIESVNPAFAQMFGYSEEEVLGQNIKLLMPEPYHSEHDGYLANYQRTGIKNIIGTGRELLAQRKDGSTLAIFLSVSEYKIGEQRFFTGTIRDLSREKEAENALLEEREKYAGIIGAALDPIILITPRGIIESVNPAFNNMFGYSDKDVLGQNIKLLMPEPYHSEHDGYLANYKETGIKNIIGTGRELQARHKDGSTLSIFLSVSEYRVDNKIRFTGTIRDISRQQETQAHLTSLTSSADMISRGDYSVDIRPRDQNDTLGLALARTTGILRNIAEVAEKLATGDTRVSVKEQSANDVLAQSINRMVATITEIAATADAISAGEIDTLIEARGPEDTLGIALARLTNIISQVSNIAEQVATGDYSVRVSSQGNKDKLSHSINSMVDTLATKTAESERQLWLANGLSQLNEALRQTTDVRGMAKAACQNIARYLNVQIMTFYVVKDEDLCLQGSYAFNKRKRLGDRIAIGEGLLGQAALDQEMISITDVPDDYARINSSIGDGQPRNIVVMPLVADGEVQGVIELAAFVELEDRKLDFLQTLKEPLGVVIRSSNEQSFKLELLEQSQAQAEELQVQQEELKASNENLEEQTKLLLASQKELKVQRDDLRGSNQLLNDKTLALEEQKNAIAMASQELEVRSKELAIASKYKSEFLANMSHELRTPLNSFLLLTDHLAKNKEGNLSAAQIEDLNIIYSGGNDLLSLINDIMDLSKVEAGKLSVQIEEHELERSCTNLRNIFTPNALSKGLDFETRIESNCPSHLQTDVQRLDQILKNFLSNAFKFTETGSVALSISAAQSALSFISPALQGKPCVAFTVSDTGIGIPEDKQLEIFAAFHQQDGTTSRQYGGTGLGLTISRELAKLLGGEIQLHSVKGQGSTFTLFLPREMTQELSDKIALNSEPTQAVSAPVTIATTANTASTATPAQNSLSKEQGTGIQPPVANTPASDDREHINSDDAVILIIEDDPVFSRLLLDIVRNSGNKALLAANGTQGLYLALEHRPKGIFLDMGLPDMDGAKVIDQLRYHTETRDIPVHIISGREPEAELLEQQKIGFLLKPASETAINEVLAKIERNKAAPITNALLVAEANNDTDDVVELLTTRGIQSTRVSDGQGALSAIAEGQYDCLIIDLELADMGGFDLLEQLSARASIPPVIIHTAAKLDPEQREKLDHYSAIIVFKKDPSSEDHFDEALSFLNNMSLSEPSNDHANSPVGDDEGDILKDQVVLLVDDDMRNTFALSRNLQEQGVTVFEADNGQNALLKLQEQSAIDLVIMDIMMPVMDGYEAMQEIREVDAWRDLPIIALTAKAMSDEREKCIAAGASDYLSKPVNMDKLIAMLKVWLYKA